MTAAIRPAVESDDAALRNLDAVTWSSDVQPGPPTPPGVSFFRPGREPRDVLVAEVDGTVVGYAGLGHALPVASSRHVLEVQGLAVDPGHARRGIGRQLVEAAIVEAARRGARRLTLRVLGSNPRARALYEKCGFAVEGVLHEEFFLEGRYVDDILMARSLPQPDAGTVPTFGPRN
ncbi:MAG: GNAT family N-acetyltransferase [Candidatus Dormibacteria bacterium]